MEPTVERKPVRTYHFLLKSSREIAVRADVLCWQNDAGNVVGEITGDIKAWWVEDC